MKELIPIGTHPIKVVEVNQKKDLYDYLEFTIKITNGKYKDSILPLIIYLVPDNMPKLEKTFSALGVEFAPNKIEVDEETQKLIKPDLKNKTGVGWVRHEFRENGFMAEIEGIYSK